MSDSSITNWIELLTPYHERLTESVVTIIENLLKAEGVEYLTITGRTKDRSSILEKIKRKGYKSPKNQLTDISGIRIILYLESDVKKASNIIEKAFSIDPENSLNKDEIMSTDQIGYRSVHFVCTLGPERDRLPEFKGLSDLKFEFQVRTVLQHAWAELAHDRNYKFSASLPQNLERKLYLYAGMLEIADKGFDEIARQIDDYAKSIEDRSKSGDLNVEINSVSLEKFVDTWAEDNGVVLHEFSVSKLDELITELRQFGIRTLEELKEIIPKGYADAIRKSEKEHNILGVVRDWMLIWDWRRLHENVQINWVLDDDEPILNQYIPEEEQSDFYSTFTLNIEETT